MSEQPQEFEDMSYIQKDDIVLVNLSLDYDICKVISKSSKGGNALYVQSLITSYSMYDKSIDSISLLIPKENLSFKYKLEDDVFLVYNDGQLVMRMPCPSRYARIQTEQYVKQMSKSYALKQLKETCKDEKVTELIKNRDL